MGPLDKTAIGDSRVCETLYNLDKLLIDLFLFFVTVWLKTDYSFKN